MKAPETVEEHLRMISELIKQPPEPYLYNAPDFLLKYGRNFTVTPRTFSGSRMKIKACYRNCAILATRNSKLTYVEGMFFYIGLAIEHAWVVDPMGNVIDPTIRNKDGQVVDQYFGVPFSTEYLIRRMLKTGCYGGLT